MSRIIFSDVFSDVSGFFSDVSGVFSDVFSDVSGELTCIGCEESVTLHSTLQVYKKKISYIFIRQKDSRPMNASIAAACESPCRGEIGSLHNPLDRPVEIALVQPVLGSNMIS